MNQRRLPLGHIVAVLFAAWIVLHVVEVVHADTGAVSRSLLTHDVFIDKQFYQNHLATPSDLYRLQRAVSDASKQGVIEKIALVWKAPPPIHTAAQAASALRNFLDFGGVVIVVAPRGIGLSSQLLSRDEMTAIAQRAGVRCGAVGRVACAIYAAQEAARKLRRRG